MVAINALHDVPRGAYPGTIALHCCWIDFGGEQIDVLQWCFGNNRLQNGLQALLRVFRLGIYVVFLFQFIPGLMYQRIGTTRHLDFEFREMLLKGLAGLLFSLQFFELLFGLLQL
jgi:hypothetical protein